MKTKHLRTSLMTAAALLASGCAQNAGPLYINKIFPIQTNCAYPEDIKTVFISDGVLDVAPGNAQFWAGIEILGGVNIIQPAVVVGNRTVEPAKRDRPIFNQVVLSYTSKPRLAGFKTAYLPRSYPVNADGQVLTYENLISPQAASVLDNIPASNEPTDGVDLKVSITFNGTLSGSNAPVTTGPLEFPIRVVRSETGTCSKFRHGYPGCNYPGQSYMSQRIGLECCDGQTDVPGCE
jgi:hypothetical protein